MPRSGHAQAIDSSGAVTRTTQLLEKPNDPASWAFVGLPNGHMLVSRNKEVLRRDAERKIVRHFLTCSPLRFQIRRVCRSENCLSFAVSGASRNWQFLPIALESNVYWDTGLI